MLNLILGILIGAGAVLLFNTRTVKLAWYDWVMLVLAVIFFLLAITNYNGSMDELESRAATFLLVSFGLPGLVLVAIVAIRAWRGMQKPAVESGQPAAAAE